MIKVQYRWRPIGHRSQWDRTLSHVQLLCFSRAWLASNILFSCDSYYKHLMTITLEMQRMAVIRWTWITRLLCPLFWCFSWIRMWTPFRGSLSARSGDVRNLRKRLVSFDSLFLNDISVHVFNFFLNVLVLFFLHHLIYLPFDLLYLRFSLLGAGDQSLPVSPLPPSSCAAILKPNIKKGGKK